MRQPSRSVISALAAASSLAILATLAAATQSTAAPSSPHPAAPSGSSCLAAIGAGAASAARQRELAAAAATYGVPYAVVAGVSYLESRWDAHGSEPSTVGGYGPMHLTDLTPPADSRARGKGGPITSDGPAALHTAEAAARLTGLPLDRVRSESAANICAGAALLASYQHALHPAGATTSAVSSWFGAVRRYSQSASDLDATTFAQRVFTRIRDGVARTTNDGQRVALRAHPGLQVPNPSRTQPAAPTDCPETLACEWIPAPYAWYGQPDPGAYGNHDLADRPNGPTIRYIVIHDTETSYGEALNLVQDPTYLAWNYTIRSSDGHVAQHLYANDVGWHAGNWYVNAHSIGIEHEGYAAQGATWFTESMYESSAALVAYLAGKYDIPLDRAHIIGHDQVPGILPKYVRGMHWDPGPYWDWQHYFTLMGVRIGGGVRATPANVEPGSVVKVAPGFADNRHKVTGCTEPGVLCPDQGTNFVYLRTMPRRQAHLVKDIGLHRHGYSTTDVADVGARAVAGQKFVVADTSQNWIAVWYLGQKAWIYVPPGHSPLVRASGQTVTVRSGEQTAPVYGRAYPERSAYPKQIPYQRVGALKYTIAAGQSYVVSDLTVPTDYYYAVTFDDSAPRDHTDVVGKDTYYQVWFGHRNAYVRAADVSLS